MARKLILQNLIKLAQGIGANPNKFMGTKTNISFLGKGPTKNLLFQSPVRIKNYLRNRGSQESVVDEINDAMGFATAGKLNPIQMELLNDNLIKIATVVNPSALPKLPSASVMPIRSGIGALKGNDIGAGPRRYNELTGLNKPRAVDPSIQQFNKDLSERLNVTAMLDQKTGMSRAIARQILQQDTRLNLPDEVLISLRTGSKGMDPLDLMRKYYGESMLKYDDFLNQVNIEAASPSEFADMVLKHVRLIPQFAEGGLAGILEV